MYSKIELLERRQLLSSSLVADFNGILPKDAVELNGVSYFLANDGVHGNELWKSDGSETGTKLVADLSLGPINSGANDTNVPEIFTAAGKVFFIRLEYADNGQSVDRFSLWTTDGTAAGTTQLAVLMSGPNNSSVAHAELDGKLILVTNDGDDQHAHVWISDGTAAGTQNYADLGDRLLGSGTPDAFSCDGRVVFTAHSDELWTTDGTAEGTFRLTSSNGATLQLGGSDATQLTNGGAVYFRTLGANGIWSTDGTIAGTQLAVELQTGFRADLHASGNQLFFFTVSETDDGNKCDMWRTDGTDAGTRKIATLDWSTIMYSASIGNDWYFINAVDARFEFWKTDGTVEGTHKLATVVNDGWMEDFAFVGNKFFYATETGDRSNRSLWVVDLTGDATPRVIRDLTTTTKNGGLINSLDEADGKLAVKLDTGTILIDPSVDTALEPAQQRVKFQNGIVYIFGTTGADQIRVYRMIQDPTKLIVAINGKIWKVNFADVTRINIYGYSGSDSIGVKEAFGRITIRSRIWGGEGNDTIITGSGRDTIYGDGGNDDIMSGTNADIAMGGLGNDDINTSYGDDTLDGQEGVDTLYAGAGSDLMNGGNDANHDHLDGGLGADVIFGKSVVDIFYSGDNVIDPSGLDSILIDSQG